MKKIITTIAIVLSISAFAQDTLTTEQKNSAKSALFDSYNVVVSINKIVEPSAEKVAEKARNIQHINIMLSKDWLSEMLTNEELQQLIGVIQ